MYILFRRNRSMTSQILTIPRIFEGVRPKKSTGNKIICWLYLDLWLHSQRKDRANSSRLQPTNRWRHRLFDIVAGVLQGDTLVPYLFIICLDYVLRTSIDKIKENSFKLTKERSRRYPAKTITDADYADHIALLANASAQVETLLHSPERAAAGIGLLVNAHNTEYMCFNQTGDISTLNGSSLKPVDKFTYQESSVSSTETDIDKRLARAWTANDRLTHKWCTPVNPFTWTSKIRTSSSNLHTAALCRYGM